MSTLPLISTPSWRQILRSNFTCWEELANFLKLNNEQKNKIHKKPKFILNVPLRIAQKIEKGTLVDPLLKQFLPLLEETLLEEQFLEDPVQDCLFREAPKFLRKYEGRVLLLCTSACAMHCRFCFRQNFDYDHQSKNFEAELDFIRKDPSIQEVILSGGDPLSLSDELLESLLLSIEKIPHVKRIRFHSRFPIGIPERIDEPLLEVIQKIKKQIWFVLHCNHARELDEDIFDALSQLKKLGVCLLNQSVLLKGVNDTVLALKELSEALIDFGILPYYLHQLDKVKGTGHFDVPIEKGKWLIDEISKLLPGYAVPKYVAEIPGEAAKTPLVS